VVLKVEEESWVSALVAMPPPRCFTAGTPIDRGKWRRLFKQRQFLDHRTSDSVALLAFGAVGVLPSASPLSRARQAAERTSEAADDDEDALGEPLLSCAVCSIARFELQLATAMARRCATAAEAEELAMEARAALCEHLASLGYLGHTERRVATTRQLCDAAVGSWRRSTPSCSRECGRLGYISATSRLYLGYISAISRLHLGYISQPRAWQARRLRRRRSARLAGGAPVPSRPGGRAARAGWTYP